MSLVCLIATATYSCAASAVEPGGPIPQPADLYSDIYSGEYPDAARRDPWR